MDPQEYIQHWNYYCSLAARFDGTKDYLYHGFCQNEDGMNCNMACTRHSLEELTATGATDACISIALDEDAILICMNKSRYSSKDVFQAIKSLHFEQNSLGSFQPHT